MPYQISKKVFLDFSSIEIAEKNKERIVCSKLTVFDSAKIELVKTKTFPEGVYRLSWQEVIESHL